MEQMSKHVLELTDDEMRILIKAVFNTKNLPIINGNVEVSDRAFADLRIRLAYIYESLGEKVEISASEFEERVRKAIDERYSDNEGKLN